MLPFYLANGSVLETWLRVEALAGASIGDGNNLVGKRMAMRTSYRNTDIQSVQKEVMHH
jgi:hypothetical protein